MLRFDNRDTGERVVSLAKVLVRIEAINAGSTRAVSADSRRRITAGLDQRAGFFSGIDERTQDTLRPQIQKTPDFILVKAQRSSEDHCLRVRCRLKHRAHGNGVVSRVLRIDHQPVKTRTPEDLHNRRVAQCDLGAVTLLARCKLRFEFSCFFKLSNHCYSPGFNLPNRLLARDHTRSRCLRRWFFFALDVHGAQTCASRLETRLAIISGRLYWKRLSRGRLSRGKWNKQPTGGLQMRLQFLRYRSAKIAGRCGRGRIGFPEHERRGSCEQNSRRA